MKLCHNLWSNRCNFLPSPHAWNILNSPDTKWKIVVFFTRCTQSTKTISPISLCQISIIGLWEFVNSLCVLCMCVSFSYIVFSFVFNQCFKSQVSTRVSRCLDKYQDKNTLMLLMWAPIVVYVQNHIYMYLNNSKVVQEL